MIKSKRFLFSLVLIIASISIYINEPLAAQSSRSLGPVHLMENTALSIQGTLRFEKSEVGKITTAKTGANSFINFIEGSGWVDASKDQFIDGYVKVLHDQPFVFPIGSDNEYRPIGISGGGMTAAAYFDRDFDKLRKRTSGRAAATSISNSDIAKISQSGYWAIDGSTATAITLTWQNVDKIGDLTEGQLSVLSVIGWKAGQWEVIPSTIDYHALNTSSSQLSTSKQLTDLVTGSITTNLAVIPNDYEYFTLGAVKVSEIASSLNFSLYPNPSLTKLPLNVAYQLAHEGEGNLQFFSSSGVLLAERTLATVNGILTLENLASVPGTYTVRITDAQGESLTKKLVVAASEY